MGHPIDEREDQVTANGGMFETETETNTETETQETETQETGA